MKNEIVVQVHYRKSVCFFVALALRAVCRRTQRLVWLCTAILYRF